MRKYLGALVSLVKIIIYSTLNEGRVKFQGVKYFIGKHVIIRTSNKGIIDIGKKTWISNFSCFECNGGKIKLGYNNFFNSNCKVVSLNKISIGDNNLFGPNVVIVDHNHKFIDKNKLICKQGFSSNPIIIGSNTWVCANVVITEGVTIGDNIIIAANSVVTKNLSESGLYAGSPAVLVKKI